MARHRGRVIVSKVDSHGVKIKGSLKVWNKKHPGELNFDSMVEYKAWLHLTTTKLKFDYQPNLVLYNSLTTNEFKDDAIKSTTQRKISYTPDFYIPKYGVYIEIKGYADPLFKLRWKLFKLAGYEGYVIYSIVELKILLKELNEISKQK